jgi:hypothetical protein
MLTSKDFWTAALERAVTAFAAALIAAIGSDQIGVLDIDWTGAASLAGTVAVLSILTSIVSGGSSKIHSVALFGPERIQVPEPPKKATATKKAPVKKATAKK